MILDFWRVGFSNNFEIDAEFWVFYFFYINLKKKLKLQN